MLTACNYGASFELYKQTCMLISKSNSLCWRKRYRKRRLKKQTLTYVAAPLFVVFPGIGPGVCHFREGQALLLNWRVSEKIEQTSNIFTCCQTCFLTIIPATKLSSLFSLTLTYFKKLLMWVSQGLLLCSERYFDMNQNLNFMF